MRQRLRATPSRSSVRGSLPVLFFGDAFSARVATIGLNPSKKEYVDQKGEMLAGRAQRFATLTSLGVSSRSDLSDAQADSAIAWMRDYFNPGKPTYKAYFGHLKNLISGMRASFAERTATHLDLVQESTDPVWRGLGVDERSSLLARDLPFLARQLEHLPHLRAVVCAGATVSRHVRSCVEVEERDCGTVELIRWWLGTARLGQRELPIGGWNRPLDQPTGLGTQGEIELGKMFARELL